MNSSFTTHYVKDLRTSPSSLSTTSTTTLTPKKQNLQKLVGSLKQTSTRSDTRDNIISLQSIEEEHTLLASAQEEDKEERALKRVILGKIVIGLYAEALDTYLIEASEAQAEAEWWADIERSRRNVVYYFIQTLPYRMVNVLRTIVQTVQSQNIPLTPSIFTPSSLRRLFPSRSAIRPSALTTALFPHLSTHPHTFTLSFPSPLRASTSSIGKNALSTISIWAHSLASVFTLPYDLTEHECRTKRQELEKLRDERAEVLGMLTDMREDLASALKDEGPGPNARFQRLESDGDKLAAFVETLQRYTAGQLATPASTPSSLGSVGVGQDIMGGVQTLAKTTIQSHKLLHRGFLESNNLNRPSRLTLLWPKFLILPPLTLLLFRSAYQSRDSLIQMTHDAGETLEAFVRDWLLEPIKGVVNTIRAGGEDGVIVRKEGVAADMDSLERMTLSLAKDKLNYSQEQLTALSKQIRVGDLTPILRIYEDDIKSPVKSAVTGTLLRSVFVQVQKAKVDIDQALAGIDKLLKSQELTFAFVGVAPAFAIVYIVGGYLKVLWHGGLGKGRFGGKRMQTSVWVAMRRVERLLIFQPQSLHHSGHLRSQSEAAIPPLTSGLLLLSVTHLRTYAERYLPMRSGLREGFLEDVQDLEDPGLGRNEKLRVVDRMWKSWGNVLGWGEISA